MIAVTGASGLAGGFTIEALQNQGFADRIRCMTRPQSDLTSIQDNPCVDLVMGDCLDVNSIRNLVRGCDCLIHIAGILYAENVIEACIEAGLKRVVFVNTTGMYTRYRKYSSEYMRMESSIVSSGLQYTIIRPTMIYGGVKDRNIRRLVRFIERIQRVVKNKAFDYSRAADELGFEPIGFEEGIQYEIRDLREHGLVS